MKLIKVRKADQNNTVHISNDIPRSDVAVVKRCLKYYGGKRSGNTDKGIVFEFPDAAKLAGFKRELEKNRLTFLLD